MPHRDDSTSFLDVLLVLHGLGPVRYCLSAVAAPTRNGGIAAAVGVATGAADGAAAGAAAMTVGHVGAGARGGGSRECGTGCVGSGGCGGAGTAVTIAPEPRLPDGRHGSLPANPLLARVLGV